MCIYNKKDYTLIIYSFAENILIWFMLLSQRNSLYRFEAPGTAYERLQKLGSFNDTTFNKGTQKDLASRMLRILSLFIKKSIATKHLKH